jgi:hypothetical protein
MKNTMPVAQVPATSNAVRPISPQERAFHQVMFESYKERLSVDPCNYYLRQEMKYHLHVITTGEIGTLCPSNKVAMAPLKF